MLGKKLSDREKGILLIAAAAAIAIVAWRFGLWLDDWKQTRATLAARREQMKLIAPGDDAKAIKAIEETARAVPVFEMPVAERNQSVLFRTRFNQQLQKAGVKVRTLEYTGTRSARRVGNYRLLRLQCRGQCQVNQALDLLATLNENPYLAGVEEIQLTPDAKNRQNVELMLIVSTLVK